MTNRKTNHTLSVGTLFYRPPSWRENEYREYRFYEVVKVSDKNAWLVPVHSTTSRKHGKRYAEPLTLNGETLLQPNTDSGETIPFRVTIHTREHDDSLFVSSKGKQFAYPGFFALPWNSTLNICDRISLIPVPIP